MTVSQVVRCLCFVSLSISVSARSSAGTIYTFSTIDVPGTHATAAGINDSGQIVGYTTGGDGFLYSGGMFTTIDVTSSANGINDSGQIVGGYSDNTGGHGFLATPTAVPEPRTLPLLAGCLIGLAVALAEQFRRMAK